MLTIVKHPLIRVKLGIMRDEKTNSKEFRENLDEIASLMCFEVFKEVGTHYEDETVDDEIRKNYNPDKSSWNNGENGVKL